MSQDDCTSSPATRGPRGIGSEFWPFYEKHLADRFTVPSIGRLVVALGAGLLFLGPHIAIVGARAFTDWSVLLAALIVVAFAFLYLATRILRDLFPVMSSMLGEGARPSVFLEPLTCALTDRKFLLCGLSVGILNTCLGHLFGVWETGLAARVSLHWGFFLAGFVGVLPAWGIRGIVVTMSQFADKGRLRLDYSAPDGCGGTLPLGIAFAWFASLTLVWGVLMSLYIASAGWTNLDDPLVVMLSWAWMAVPYLCAILVLVAPSLEIHRALSAYKLNKCLELQAESTRVRAEVRAGQGSAEEREASREYYEFLKDLRQQVHAMRTWPYRGTSLVKFASVVAGNALVTAEGVQKLLQKIPEGP